MFSVLISIYSKENPVFLKEAFDSILAQTLLPDELVLVKDGPLSDELESVISNYLSKITNMKVISLPQNVGLGQALNLGIQHCSHNLIARMDTDDISKPNRFEKQIRVFCDKPEVEIVSSWIDEFEKNPSNVVSVRKLPEEHFEILHYAKHRCPINHPVVMFKKDAVLKAGGYLHFPLFEDYYLWIRMLMNGSIFYNLQESLLYYRFTSDMFKRRGGLKYGIDELYFQNMMRKNKFISNFLFIKNVLIRFAIRLFPNFLRRFIYVKMLR